MRAQERRRIEPPGGGGGGTRGPERRDQDGSVSGEFAVALPAVVLVLTLLLGLGMHAAAQVTLEEGARAAARELARGESEGSAAEAARRISGDAVQVTTTTEGEFARVRLSRPVRLVGLLELSVEQTAEAVARVEQLPGAAPRSGGRPSEGLPEGTPPEGQTP